MSSSGDPKPKHDYFLRGNTKYKSSSSPLSTLGPICIPPLLKRRRRLASRKYTGSGTSGSSTSVVQNPPVALLKNPEDKATGRFRSTLGTTARSTPSPSSPPLPSKTKPESKNPETKTLNPEDVIIANWAKQVSSILHNTASTALERESVDPVKQVLLDNIEKSSRPRDIEEIFNHDSHKCIFNCSAAGKTRRTLEGLARNWGIYLVGAVDSSGIGANDLSQVADMHPARALRDPTANYEEKKKENKEFQWVLLGRILILEPFLDYLATLGTEHSASTKKILWTLFQVQYPGFCLPNDILKYMLIKAFGEEVDPSDFLKRAHKRVTSMLKQRFPDEAEDLRLFCVIDEAQALFSPRVPSFSPVLREILQSFSAADMTMIIVGTSLDLQSVQRGVRDTGRDVKIISDLGGFDDPEEQLGYLVEVMPDDYKNTESAKALETRYWNWCRGRYRYTSTCLGVHAMNKFKSPHTIFNQYITSLTGIRPSDFREYKKFSSQEPVVEEERLYGLYLELLSADPRYVEKALEATKQYDVDKCITIIEEEDLAVPLVRIGIARYRNVESRGVVAVIDEPIVFFHLHHWLLEKKLL